MSLKRIQELNIALDKIEKEVAGIEEILSSRRIVKRVLLYEYLGLRWEVKPRAIVKHKRLGICRVVRIDKTWGKDKPWIKVNIKKKDGSWGVAEHHLFGDWEIKCR